MKNTLQTTNTLLEDWKSPDISTIIYNGLLIFIVFNEITLKTLHRPDAKKEAYTSEKQGKI